MKDIGKLIKEANVTLTDRILYFPKFCSRPPVEYKPYHIYENSDCLLLAYKEKDVAKNCLKGILEMHAPECMKDLNTLYIKHKDILEEKVLELAYKHHM